MMVITYTGLSFVTSLPDYLSLVPREPIFLDGGGGLSIH